MLTLLVDNMVSRSRNGTVRNTDSFFKDDTVETKKISLTPNLLRDEVGGGSGVSSTEAKEVSMSRIADSGLVDTNPSAGPRQHGSNRQGT